MPGASCRSICQPTRPSEDLPTLSRESRLCPLSCFFNVSADGGRPNPSPCVMRRDKTCCSNTTKPTRHHMQQLQCHHNRGLGNQWDWDWRQLNRPAWPKQSMGQREGRLRALLSVANIITAKYLAASATTTTTRTQGLCYSFQKASCFLIVLSSRTRRLCMSAGHRQLTRPRNSPLYCVFSSVSSWA